MTIPFSNSHKTSALSRTQQSLELTKGIRKIKVSFKRCRLYNETRSG